MINEKDRKEVERIKKGYIVREATKIDELKALDKKVKLPAKIFGYVYGSIGSLILGTGMCLAMEIIGNLMPLGIVIGLLGIAMVSTTYTIYKTIQNNRKIKYGAEIVSLSEELLNNTK